MVKEFKVENTQLADLALLHLFYDEAIRYQQTKGFPVWINFDNKVLENDVLNGNHYKVLVDSQVAIVFSVCYSDKIIWRDMEKGNALYLHRIVVNPAFRGQKLFGVIVDWTTGHARRKKLQYIRMDTWANNAVLIEYYKSFGFAFIEQYTTPDSIELPAQNRKLELALLELRV
jgi:ribosomal protein S18 acetylase RimI-like enzyme